MIDETTECPILTCIDHPAIGVPRNLACDVRLGDAALGQALVEPIVQTKWVKLLASDGQEGDFFGTQVAISGDTIVVGAMSTGDNGTRSGSAHRSRHNSARGVPLFLVRKELS